MVLVLLSGIVQWKSRALQLPGQLGGKLYNRAALPTQKQWQWMLAGIMSLLLMSTVVGTGATFLQNSIKFYGMWVSDLLWAFLMLSVWALAWFVVVLRCRPSGSGYLNARGAYSRAEPCCGFRSSC